MSSLNISQIRCCCQCSLRDINALPSFPSTPPLRESPDACASSCSPPISSQPRHPAGPSQPQPHVQPPPHPPHFHAGQYPPRTGTARLMEWHPGPANIHFDNRGRTRPKALLVIHLCPCHPCDVQSRMAWAKSFCLQGLVC